MLVAQPGFVPISYLVKELVLLDVAMTVCEICSD